MKEKILGLVIKKLHHSDRVDVVHLYSSGRGRIACVASPGKSRGKASVLRPMTLIEGTISSGKTSALPRLSGVSVADPLGGIASHPGKTAVALFLLEFLDRFLQTAEGDERLWNFIVASLKLFDRMKEGWPDFHIVFLSVLTGPAGIRPDIRDASRGSFFDLRAASYTDIPPAHPDYLRGPLARIPMLLARVNFRSVKALHLCGAQRTQLLEGILRYYSFHLPDIGKVKAHRILADIFS